MANKSKCLEKYLLFMQIVARANIFVIAKVHRLANSGLISGTQRG